MKLSHILGINARTKLYSYPYNSWRGKRIARSKIQTEKILKGVGIPTPRILKKFRNTEDIDNYDWASLQGSFVLKPSKGLGGEGIIVVKKRLKNKVPTWLTANKRRVQIVDLKLHVLDILEGAYSIGNVPDVAFIQEYVGRHRGLMRYSFRGTPDVRVIVFNKVPVLAMLRLPTRDSEGRSNLHQGAIGAGIDIATGITTSAIWYDQQIKETPDHNRKIYGIKIPQWNRILEMSVDSQVVSKLGYVGVDIVIHPEKGPMVMELNSSPGIQIQLANMAGLRKRLDRVEDLEVRNASHGVEIAKALFSDKYGDRRKAEEGIKTLKAVESVYVLNNNRKKVSVLAKVDTGAWSSSIDINFAKKIGIFSKSKVLWYRKKLSALGEEDRAVIPMTFWLSGRKIKTTVTVADRKALTYKMIIGRTDLTGFLVDPEIEPEKLEAAQLW